ncbi:MAG TPA: MFS transporter [Patescibacteria group bacterium]|nr:MFS transporter [Patescibacteria group bacterium]
MFKNNRPLLIVSLIAIVNALGYGIIIPIQFSYAARFGLSNFQNGLLFSLFSLCQFLSSPVIGNFSDRFGRRPLLILSLAGTVLSFLTMAFAPSAIFLFIARALDGLTAGNVPVAMSVISDTVEPKDRAKGFGIIGAAFGFGFVFGPAISALTVGINPSLPFIIAAVITFISVVITWFMLPETNQHIGQVNQRKLFDFPKLAKSIVDENVGSTLMVGLIYALAFGLLIYAYNPFAKSVLGLSDTVIALNFVIFGIVGLVAQGFLIPQLTKRIADKKLMIQALIISVVGFFGVFIAHSYLFFVITSIFISLSNSFVQPLIASLLSKEVDFKSQGEIMGINQSYASIGTIFGPIIGGLMASVFSVASPFLGGALLSLVCVYVGYQIFKKPEKVVSLE